MMAWIESHQSLGHHRKTLKATTLLRVDRHKLIGHLHTLWWWALDNVPDDGSLDGIEDEVLVVAAEWDGKANFAEALRQAGFIDERGLHNWELYSGKLSVQRALRRESNRKAQSARRQRLRQQGVSADSQQSQHPTEQNSTQHNSTGHSSTEAVEEAAAAFKAYEDCIGSLSAYMGRKVDEDVTEFGSTCVIHCLEEAAGNGARNLKYAESIMRRHQAEGCYDNGRQDNEFFTAEEVERRVAWLAETRRQAL